MAVLESRPDRGSSSSTFAQLGTCAHTLGEKCLTEGTNPDEYKDRLIQILLDEEGKEVGTSMLRKGAKLPKGELAERTYEVDDDMIEAVTCFTEYVRRRVDELGLTMKNVRLEGHVVPLPSRDDTGGTADVIIDAWPEILEVVDYKHGSGVFVPVEGNEQLRSYALGALLETGDALYDYENVRYTICQPRHLQAPSDGIMSEDAYPYDLIMWGKWLEERAGVVDDARALVQARATFKEVYDAGFISVGEDGSHCTFCDLLDECPAARAKTQEVAALDFDDEPEEITSVTQSRLATLLPWMPFIDKWVRAVETAGEGALLRGDQIEGYKLVHGRSNRSWGETIVLTRDEDGEAVISQESTDDSVVEVMASEFGVQQGSLFTDPKRLTGPQVEKLVPKEDRPRFNEMFLIKAESKLTMVPDDDKRAAVEVNPADDFDDDPDG